MVALQVFRYGFLIAGGVGVYVSIEEEHPAQAIFRGFLGIFTFFKWEK